jgi:hypothetical protein
MIAFGEFVASRRKDLKLTQREVATGRKQDGSEPLSVEY